MNQNIQNIKVYPCTLRSKTHEYIHGSLTIMCMGILSCFAVFGRWEQVLKEQFAFLRAKNENDIAVCPS